MEKRERKDLETRVTKIIFDMGIPAHIQGYCFIRSAVIMAIERPEIIENITKALYIDLAKEYNTTPSRIERSIRHAITVAWKRGPTQTTIDFFGKKQESKVVIVSLLLQLQRK